MSEVAIAIAEAIYDRDPREAPFGLFFGGSFVLDSVRIFGWFKSPSEMAEHLLNVEPIVLGFEGDDLQDFKQRLMPLMDRLKVDGLVPELLADLNAEIKDVVKVEWWGQFNELVEGKTEFAKNILAGFLDDGETTLSKERLDDFIEYLKSCGC